MHHQPVPYGKQSVIPKPKGFFRSSIPAVQRQVIEAVRKGKKAVIFDCDGVILADYKSKSEMYYWILREYGFDASIDKVMQLCCDMGSERLFRAIVPESRQKGGIIAMMLQSVADSILEQVKMIGPTSLLLKTVPAIRKMGAQTGNVTNRYTGLDYLMEKFSFSECFHFILSAEHFEPKPSPQMLNRMLELMKIKPPQAIFIGDRQSDMDAGKNANIDTYLVKWEYVKKAA